MKPVLFLDVDDTLLDWKTRQGLGGRCAATFLRWAKQHFEVRWLTMWCPGGTVDPDFVPALAARLGVTQAEVSEVVNPHPFPVRLSGDRDKSESIRAMLSETPDRAWVWVEDQFLDCAEMRWLREDVAHAENYYMTTVSRDPVAIIATAGRLAARFKLPAMDTTEEIAEEAKNWRSVVTGADNA